MKKQAKSKADTTNNANNTNESGGNMTEKAWKNENGIEIRTGNSNIILIAPHGCPGDDDYTGDVVRTAANELNAYAYVNEFYEKPDPLIKNEGKINVNRQKHVKKHLEDEFLSPLKSDVNQAIKDHGKALLVFVHGIEDGNADAEGIELGMDTPPDVLVGYGQRETNQSLTAEKDTVLKVINGLSEGTAGKVSTCLAREGSGYCGADANNMNQWCRAEGFSLDQVQSIQLEFRKIGFRDKKGNIERTGKILASALKGFPSEHEAPANVEAEIEAEKSGDALAQEAYSKLTDIISANHENAMVEAGKYIIEKFYGDDNEKARKKRAVNEEGIKSLNKVIQKMSKGNPGAPKKSWVYNSVALVVQNADIEKEYPALFHTYGNFQLSKKVLLLPVPLKEKGKLIEKAAKGGWAAKKLREKISAKKNRKNPPRKASLVKIVKNPEKLFGKDYDPAKILDSLKALPPEQIKQIETGSTEMKKKLEQDLKSIQDTIANYTGLIEENKESLPGGQGIQNNP